LGVTIYKNAGNNFLWTLAGAILIITTLYPLWLFFSTFLSKKPHTRVRTLESIIMLIGIQLIAIGIILLFIWLATIEHLRNFAIWLGISNPQPVVLFVIFELWGAFIYYLNHNFEPYFEKERFSLLIETKKQNGLILTYIQRFFNVFFEKGIFIFTLVIYIFFIAWCFQIQENIQAIAIIIIGIINSYLIFNYKKKLKKNRKKVGS